MSDEREPGVESEDAAARQVADSDGASTQDESLRRFKVFVGKNADRFAEIYENSNNKMFNLRYINWCALLLGVPWFFYRKLFLVGAAAIIVPVLLFVAIPQLADIGLPGYGIILAFIANPLYVQIARKRVAKIEALDLPREELEERLRKAGGTSRTGLVLGLVIVVALLIVPFVYMRQLTLPECTDPGIAALAQEALEDNLVARGFSAEGLELSNFHETPTQDETRSCNLTVSIDGETSDLRFILEWTNKQEGQYSLQFM